MTRISSGYATYAEAIAETDIALLVRVPEHEDKPVWIPKSQITDDSEVYRNGDTGELEITEWLAEQRGWC